MRVDLRPTRSDKESIINKGSDQPGSGSGWTGRPTTEQSNLDTAPQRAVDAPLSAAAAGRAAGDVSSVLLIRSIVAGFAAVALVVAVVFLFRHGVRNDNFPPVLSGTTTTVITRYSAPWISGAAGVALLAGLSFTSAAVDLFRRIRWQRARRPDSTRSAH